MAIAKTLLTKYKVDSAGAEKGLSSIVGVATKAAAALAGIGTGVLAIAKSTANYRDELAKASRAAGVSVEAFSSMSDHFDLAGVSVGNMTKVFQKLNAPTKKQVEILETLGVELKDASGNATTADERFRSLTEKMEGFSVADQAAVNLSLFGEESAKVTNVTIQGRKELDKSIKKTKEYGRVVSEAAAKDAEAFNDSISNLGKSLAGAKDRLGESVIQLALQSGAFEVLESAIKGVSGFFKIFNEENDSFLKVAGSTAAQTVAIGGGIFFISKGISSLITGLKAAALAASKLSKSNIILLGASLAVAGGFALYNNLSEKKKKATGDDAKATAKATEEETKAKDEMNKLTADMEARIQAIRDLQQGKKKDIGNTKKQTAAEKERAAQLEKLRQAQAKAAAEAAKYRVPDWLKETTKYTSALADITSQLAEAAQGFVDWQLQGATHRIEAEEHLLATLDITYQDDINNFERAQAKKTRINQEAMNERIAIQDEEYRQKKAMLEASIQEELDMAQASYEEQLEFIETTSADREQRQLTSIITTQDHQNAVTNIDRKAEESRAKLLTDHENKKKAITKESEKKASDIKASAEKERAIIDIKYKNAQIKSENKIADLRWEAENKALETMKPFRVAEVTANLAAGIASAYSRGISEFGIVVGSIMASIVSALLTATAVAQIGRITSQKSPPKPPSQPLIEAPSLETGGVLRGARHAEGGIPATLEGGEAVIDRDRTERLMSNLDQEKVSVVMESGAVQVLEFDEETIEMLSLRIYDRIREARSDRVYGS